MFFRYLIFYKFCLFIFIQLKLSASAYTPCILRRATYGYVCVCNTTYCDYADRAFHLNNDKYVLTSSSKGGLRFSRKHGNFSSQMKVEDLAHTNKQTQSYDESSLLKKKSLLKKMSIHVDRSKTFQEMIGFGGALTGASSYVIDKMPLKLQDAAFKSLYSKKGIAFTIMRLPLAGCDFDLSPWAYNELPENDKHLTNFTHLDPRDIRRVKQIKRIKKVAKIDEIKIIALAWSPPRWMKTNNDWKGFAVLKKEYYQTWADYHLRYLELMDASNISIWALSTGNEPNDGITAWVSLHFMSLGWTPREQAIWVADNFGPTIKNSKFKNVKLFSNDDQIMTFPVWFREMNATRKESMDYIDGLSIHWYLDSSFGMFHVKETHLMYPDKILLSTETSVVSNGPRLGCWKHAEKYIRKILEDLQESFNGYIDWNIVLNEKGGPNYVKNYVDAPIIMNTTNGKEFYKQPLFYAIGHFSKFIPEGSVRIKAVSSNTNSETKCQTVAFERPDGTVTCVFHNGDNEPVAFTFTDTIRGEIEITIPPKSVHTIEYN